MLSVFYQQNSQLYLGTLQQAATLTLLKEFKILTVISVGNNIPLFYQEKWGIKHYIYPYEEQDNYQSYCDVFQRTSQQINQNLKEGNVLIHCTGQNMCASATISIAYLMDYQDMTYEKSFYYIKSLQASIHLTLQQKKQLSNYALNFKTRSIFKQQSISLSDNIFTSKGHQSVKKINENYEQIIDIIDQNRSESPSSLQTPHNQKNSIFSSQNQVDFSFQHTDETQDDQNSIQKNTPFDLNGYLVQNQTQDVKQTIPTFQTDKIINSISKQPNKLQVLQGNPDVMKKIKENLAIIMKTELIKKSPIDSFRDKKSILTPSEPKELIEKKKPNNLDNQSMDSFKDKKSILTPSEPKELIEKKKPNNLDNQSMDSLKDKKSIFTPSEPKELIERKKPNNLDNQSMHSFRDRKSILTPSAPKEVIEKIKPNNLDNQSREKNKPALKERQKQLSENLQIYNIEKVKLQIQCITKVKHHPIPSTEQSDKKDQRTRMSQDYSQSDLWRNPEFQMNKSLSQNKNDLSSISLHQQQQYRWRQTEFNSLVITQSDLKEKKQGQEQILPSKKKHYHSEQKKCNAATLYKYFYNI